MKQAMGMGPRESSIQSPATCGAHKDATVLPPPKAAQSVNGWREGCLEDYLEEMRHHREHIIEERRKKKISRMADKAIRLISDVLASVPAERLAEIYRVKSFQTGQEFLESLAEARGKVTRGGLPDMVAVAKMVLQDWNSLDFPYFTMHELLPNVKSLRELEDSEVARMSGMDSIQTTDKLLEVAADSPLRKRKQPTRKAK